MRWLSFLLPKEIHILDMSWMQEIMFVYLHPGSIFSVIRSCLEYEIRGKFHIEIPYYKRGGLGKKETQAPLQHDLWMGLRYISKYTRYAIVLSE